MFPEWVSLLQRPLHPCSLVLWWRSWLFWQLWRTPLLQWVPDISFTCLKCVCGLPLSAVCLCLSHLHLYVGVRKWRECCSRECESVVYFFVLVLWSVRPPIVSCIPWWWHPSVSSDTQHLPLLLSISGYRASHWLLFEELPMQANEDQCFHHYSESFVTSFFNLGNASSECILNKCTNLAQKIC